jgi:hypothetical protein
MKYIKQYEISLHPDYKYPTLKVGDFVIMNINWGDNYNSFGKNTIGEIIDIYAKDYDGWSMRSNDKKIIATSKLKDNLEKIIVGNKYNL